ncbi:hypothetical protein CRV24_001133 [Beauveria bassiana]|nr:hypothetical protein CRV24_001133 [Beauveria bassiana]KAH8720290.1 hypothetical protein HC256_000688 [Beauveria bassiana]
MSTPPDANLINAHIHFGGGADAAGSGWCGGNVLVPETLSVRHRLMPKRSARHAVLAPSCTPLYGGEALVEKQPGTLQ